MNIYFPSEIIKTKEQLEGKLNYLRHEGVKPYWSSFPIKINELEEEQLFWKKTQSDKVDRVLERTLAFSSCNVISRKTINFFVKNSVYQEIEGRKMWVFYLPDLGYKKYKGVPYGYPKNNLDLDFPFLMGQFQADSNEYYSQSFGNRFNGGYTIHVTDEFIPEELTDAIGTPCITKYRSPGHIDGWGTGFKGGFFVVPLENQEA